MMTGERGRIRDLGVAIGPMEPGRWNAITDVEGIRVGHATRIEGDSIRTGLTLIQAHPGNPFQEKVPAAVVTGNGYGKPLGFEQVRELGNLESPIALTSTLSVGKVADALVEQVLSLDGNEAVGSINVVVGETNDGRLNDIRGRHVGAPELEAAVAALSPGTVPEGAVGAGTGTVCFGWKGGIGTSSRVVDEYTVGVLVQTNFGGHLCVDGVSLRERLEAPFAHVDDGSCMIVVATDAPVCARNLERLGRRALVGMARTGASFSNGSGDFVVALSTAPSLRIVADGETTTGGPVLRNERMNPLFRGVADATEEAILNSLTSASPVESRSGSFPAIPLDRLQALLNARS